MSHRDVLCGIHTHVRSIKRLQSGDIKNEEKPMVEIYRRRGRSLSPTIAQSKKVAKLSRGAIIIYTWGLAFFDDYGWGEGDPEDVKNLIVPRLDFTTEIGRASCRERV